VDNENENVASSDVLPDEIVLETARLIMERFASAFAELAK